MELRRTKNIATIITFPLPMIDGTYLSSATDLDSQIEHWSDSVAPNGFSACINEAIEIDSTGIYYLELTQAENNYDYSMVKTTSTSSGSIPQSVLINRTLQQSDMAAISGSVVAASNAEAFFASGSYDITYWRY